MSMDLWLNNASSMPTRLTSSSTANPFSPHSTFDSLSWCSTLILNSMIDLSEEEVHWNISTTSKVCLTPRLVILGFTVISILNGPHL